MTTKLETLDYEVIVAKLKQGDEATYQWMIGRWHGKIFNFAFRYSNDREFAAEVVQKTFIHVFEKINQLNDASKLRAWIYRIASNCCASEGRSKQRHQTSMLNQEVFARTDHATPASHLEREETRNTVKEVLQLIPPEQRQVIIMKEYDGLKFREIAEITGESENTIKSRMYYGLDAMRKILSQKKIEKGILL